jgi:hypothetical protein
MLANRIDQAAAIAYLVEGVDVPVSGSGIDRYQPPSAAGCVSDCPRNSRLLRADRGSSEPGKRIESFSNALR